MGFQFFLRYNKTEPCTDRLLDYTLAAVASGIVSGIGNDPILGICQTIRYGEYEVTYGHLSNVFAQFGQRVKAGQTVALSGKPPNFR